MGSVSLLKVLFGCLILVSGWAWSKRDRSQRSVRSRLFIFAGCMIVAIWCWFSSVASALSVSDNTPALVSAYQTIIFVAVVAMPIMCCAVVAVSYSIPDDIREFLLGGLLVSTLAMWAFLLLSFCYSLTYSASVYVARYFFGTLSISSAAVAAIPFCLWKVGECRNRRGRKPSAS